VFVDITLGTRAKKSARQRPFKANDFSARFNRNSATPEISKQAAERKRSSQDAAFYELPPNCRQTFRYPFREGLPVIRPK
jgi:hypothetical protein